MIEPDRSIGPSRLTAQAGRPYNRGRMSELGPNKFDPHRAITVDLPAGHVRVALACRVLLPAQALVAMCSAAGEAATVALGRAVGEAMGERLKVRFATGAEAVGDPRRVVRGAPFGVVIEHLAGELALAGLGALSAERWGKALALVVDRSPVADEAIGDVLLCGVLAGALATAAGADAAVVPVAREGHRSRFLVLRDGAVEGVLASLEAGTPWSQVVAALNGAVA